MVEATPVGSRMCQYEAPKTTAADILTHGYNISNNGVTKSDVSGNGHQDVNRCCRSNAGYNNLHHAGWRVVVDFVDDGKHLKKVSGFNC